MIDWSPTYRERVSPNIGIVTVEEQDRLRQACIGIAGCGAIGGHAAADFAYWGIGHLKLADFDVFETSNANRQLYAAFSTIGLPKVQVVAQNVSDVSPDIKLDLYTQGITLDNAGEFVDGCDLILDAIDYEEPKFSVALHRAARNARIPVFVSQCIGFGASMLVFDPDGPTYENFFGIPSGRSLTKITLADIDLAKLVPLVPDYLDQELLRRIINGELEAPTVIAGQTIAVGLTVTEMVLRLINRPGRMPLRMSVFDAFKGEARASSELSMEVVAKR